MMNSIYPWSVFLEVADQKSFVKAAEALNITQSSVSHTIAKLEAQQGYPLFIRNRNNVELTANGKILLPYVREIIASCSVFEQELSGLRDLDTGVVRVGAFNSAAAMWLIDIIKEFKEEHPHFSIKLFQNGDKKVAEMIKNGSLDLAFLSSDLVKNDSFIPIHRTPLVCLMPRDYVPANGVSVTPEELQDKKLILQAEGYDTEMMRYLMDHGLELDSDFRIEVDSTCHKYVEQGYGYCLAGKMTVDSAPADVSMWPLEPPMYRVIGLVTVSPDYISPAASLFRNAILKYMNEKGLVNV